MSVILISGEDEFINHVSKNQEMPDLILAYFTAKWCGPCKTISPIIENIAENNPHIKVLKIDVDDCEEVSEMCEIECMPTFKFYKNNNLECLETLSGADKEGLVNIIQRLLKTQ
tara:strand:+ start:146 stop:487 length:342 start_codon:yes stop_codon:yes gene_type:complete